MAEEKRDKKQPDWKDYIAITIAALQTVFLPFILLVLVLLVFVLAISGLASL